MPDSKVSRIRNSSRPRVNPNKETAQALDVVNMFMSHPTMRLLRYEDIRGLRVFVRHSGYWERSSNDFVPTGGLLIEVRVLTPTHPRPKLERRLRPGWQRKQLFLALETLVAQGLYVRDVYEKRKPFLDWIDAFIAARGLLQNDEFILAVDAKEEGGWDAGYDTMSPEQAKMWLYWLQDEWDTPVVEAEND